jgi:hypothetical protein
MGYVFFVELCAKAKILPKGTMKDFGEEAALIVDDRGPKLVAALDSCFDDLDVWAWQVAGIMRGK